ncbi:MAG: G1 family glutamic endopeptidase [Candidatus Sulfotelmatobacter sp.]
MKTTNNNTPAATPKNAGGPLALTALLLCGLAIPTAAQTASITKVADEKGFTIAPNVQTAIVLKSTPDAACDLHAEGVSDRAQTLRFYANGDGYLKIHANPKQESDEIRLQLDCTENGKLVRYPLHLRASFSPTEDMPAPESVMPTPKGSKILPGLTEAETHQLSDDELINRGYSMRPDAATSPEQYAKWLDRVSQPMTLVPAHLVSRSDISHRTQGIQGGISDNYNWSGYVAKHSKRSYSANSGDWNVPEVIYAEANHSTYSAFWIGLDGYGLSDLEQAGTEQDAIDLEPFGYFANYSAWTELLPNQLTEQDVSLSPNPGDRMGVEVWISTGSGAPNAKGGYAAFRLQDVTQGQGTGAIYTPLDGTYYNGSEAEWIMERPCLASVGENCTQFAELSDYNYAQMLEASALTTGGSWKKYSAIENTQLWMYNEYKNGDDNNWLSEAFSDIYADTSTDIYFQWINFH